MQWFDGAVLVLALLQLVVLVLLLVRRPTAPPPSPLQEVQRQELLALVKNLSLIHI